jgi:hypothetical protein
VGTRRGLLGATRGISGGHRRVRRAGRDEDARDIYAGPLSISSRAYVFQILWNAGGETAANAALAAMRTVRIQ